MPAHPRSPRWLVLVLAALVVALVAGASGGSRPTLLAAEAPATGSTVTLAAVGDFSASGAAGRVLQSMARSAPDAMLALGDLSYGPTGQEQAWCDFVVDKVGAGAPFELLAGNHESDGQHGNINDFSACLPNQLPGLRGTYGRQYAVDLPQRQPLVRYVAISPAITFPGGTDGFAAGTPRYQWLADQIDTARAAGVRWVVVGMHKPCLSVGGNPCEVGADLQHLLMSKRVDVVLSGHEHHYTRMSQLAIGPGCAALEPGTYDPDCVTDADDDLEAGAGTVFAVIGTGGAGLHDVNFADAEYPYVRHAIANNLNPTSGHAALSLTDGGLSFAFERTDGTVADAFTLTSPTSNRAPTAAFTASGTDLTRRLDATLATDTDGAIASYTWDFGDQTSATGKIVDHTWSAPGTYAVRLSVVDADGATSSTVQQVDVAGSSQVLAADGFERSATRAWGSADVGGPWSVSTASGISSVAGGLGRTLLTDAVRSTLARLPGVSAPSTDLTVDLSLDRLPTGTGGRVDVSAVARRTSAGDEYRALVKVAPDGVARLSLGRFVGGAFKRIGPEVAVPGGAVIATGTMRLRVRAVGSGPTTLRAKAWPAGASEPTGWQVSATDAEAALQQSGSIALRALTAPLTTNRPIEVRFDALRAVPAS